MTHGFGRISEGSVICPYKRQGKEKNMKTRIMTAAVMVPLLFVLLPAGAPWSAVLISAFISVAAAHELLVNSRLKNETRLRVFSYITAGLIPLWSLLDTSLTGLQLLIFVLFILLFAEAMLSRGRISIANIGLCLIAGIMLPFIFSGLVRLGIGENGRMLVLVPFIICFMSDAGAYFTGLAIGKHHFAPYVSPNKTLEGVAGGVVWGIAAMLLYALVINSFTSINASYAAAALYGGLGSLAATFGDLCFSYIKREMGIKDFGKLIPGHGGVLDRFDSLTTVLLLTEILVTLLPVFIG